MSLLIKISLIHVSEWIVQVQMRCTMLALSCSPGLCWRVSSLLITKYWPLSMCLFKVWSLITESLLASCSESFASFQFLYKFCKESILLQFCVVFLIRMFVFPVLNHHFYWLLWLNEGRNPMISCWIQWLLLKPHLTCTIRIWHNWSLR